MMYFLMSGLLLAGGLFAYLKRKYTLDVPLFFLYGLTSGLLGLFLKSHWRWMIEMRYFLYVISGALAVGIPLIFLVDIYALARQLLKGNMNVKDHWIAVGSLVIQGSIVLSVFMIFLLRSDWWHILLTLMMYVTMYYFVLFFIFIALTIFLALWPKSRQARTILVLGRRLRNGILSPHLAYRIDAACRLYNERPTIERIIVTGGRGHGDEVSEAQQMKKALMNGGIPDVVIVEEAVAQNTEMNFILSRLLIPDSEMPVIVVTNFFHIFRSSIFAWKSQVRGQFYAAKTVLWTFPYQLIREFMGIILMSRGWNMMMIFLTVIYVLRMI